MVTGRRAAGAESFLPGVSEVLTILGLKALPRWEIERGALGQAKAQISWPPCGCSHTAALPSSPPPLRTARRALDGHSTRNGGTVVMRARPFPGGSAEGRVSFPIEAPADRLLTPVLTAAHNEAFGQLDEYVTMG
jgi:hypothetical protein